MPCFAASWPRSWAANGLRRYFSGSPNTWASGIVRAVGGVNFLHDKSQTPYMRSTDIDHYLGISESSGAAKLAAIRKMLKMHQLDPTGRCRAAWAITLWS